MKTLRALVVAAVVALPMLTAGSLAQGFDLRKLMGYGDYDPTLNTFKLIHVADLKKLMQEGKSGLYLYDANDAEVRAKYGAIPGAVLLPSDDQYPLSMLPADKHAELVFYCTNWLCTASHEAARRAVGAGYEDVSVMSDGIMGWAKAGEPTTLSTTTEGRSNS